MRVHRRLPQSAVPPRWLPRRPRRNPSDPRRHGCVLFPFLLDGTAALKTAFFKKSERSISLKTYGPPVASHPPIPSDCEEVSCTHALVVFVFTSVCLRRDPL